MRFPPGNEAPQLRDAASLLHRGLETASHRHHVVQEAQRVEEAEVMPPCLTGALHAPNHGPDPLAGVPLASARLMIEKSRSVGITNRHRPPLRVAHTSPTARFSSESAVS